MSKKTDFEEMVDVEDTQADEVEIVDLEKKPTEYDPDWSEYLLDESMRVGSHCNLGENVDIVVLGRGSCCLVLGIEKMSHVPGRIAVNS